MLRALKDFINYSAAEVLSSGLNKGGTRTKLRHKCTDRCQDKNKTIWRNIHRLGFRRRDLFCPFRIKESEELTEGFTLLGVRRSAVAEFKGFYTAARRR